MAQMQNIIDFPPAPKLDPLGQLDPSKATRAGAGRREDLHGQGPLRRMPRPADRVHGQQDARPAARAVLQDGSDRNDLVMMPDGPIKTFTLRGIKDSPPYLHDGRLLTLADTVEFFNLVLGLKLTDDEKRAWSPTCWRSERSGRMNMKRLLATASALPPLPRQFGRSSRAIPPARRRD